MLSVKYALVIVAAFIAGSFLTPPVQQAIAAVIATDVQCTGCVGSADLASSAVTNSKIASNAVTTGKIADGTITAADLASNSVNGGKIADGTISAADLGPDSVGASEMKGVTKLMFFECSITDNTSRPTLGGQNYLCDTAPTNFNSDEVALATNNGNFCYVANAVVTNAVFIHLTNICSSSNAYDTGTVAVVIFKTG